MTEPLKPGDTVFAVTENYRGGHICESTTVQRVGKHGMSVTLTDRRSAWQHRKVVTAGSCARTPTEAWNAAQQALEVQIQELQTELQSLREAREAAGE